MNRLRIAIFQTSIIWENKKQNFIQLKEKIKSFRDKGIDMVFLPEMSFTGFSMNIGITKDNENETLAMVSKLARKEKIAIGFGWVSEDDGKGKNHYTVVGKGGNVLSDYVKIHPFSFAHEDEYFDAGNGLSIYEMNGIPMSNFICYDLRFPEIFQIVSEKAHIIAVPANWPAKRAEQWDILLRARAIENQVYIVAINCIGNIGGIDYRGESCVINPNGDVLDKLEKEGVLICDINDDVDAYRCRFPVKDDRKNELYRTLKI